MAKTGKINSVGKRSVCHDPVLCIGDIARPNDVGRKANTSASALYSIQRPSVLRKHLLIGQFNFFFAFHWSPSIGKHDMTTVSFVKTMVSSLTINRQILYDPGIPRQDYKSDDVCQ